MVLHTVPRIELTPQTVHSGSANNPNERQRGQFENQAYRRSGKTSTHLTSWQGENGQSDVRGPPTDQAGRSSIVIAIGIDRAVGERSGCLPEGLASTGTDTVRALPTSLATDSANLLWL